MKLVAWLNFVVAFVMLFGLAKDVWSEPTGFGNPDFSWHRVVETISFCGGAAAATFFLSAWWEQLNKK